MSLPFQKSNLHLTIGSPGWQALQIPVFFARNRVVVSGLRGTPFALPVVMVFKKLIPFLAISIVAFSGVAARAQDRPVDARRIAADQAEQQRVQELLDAVQRMREESDERLAAIRRGESVEPSEERSERWYKLFHALSQYQTPIVIPGLVLFIGNGGGVQDVLADFGEQAMPALLPLAAGNDNYIIGSTLRTFAKMLTRSSVRNPLSSDSRQKIVDIARARMRGGHPSLALASIYLAVATREPDLIERVTLIASDGRFAVEFGIGGAPDADRLQGYAARTLKEAGIGP